MNPIVKKILTILVMVAVLVYVVVNYVMGNSNLFYFVVALGILGYPLISIVASLVDDLKNL